ncbi:DUF1214 domain-containing protein [Caenibius sp. WL]|uniref:DUF1214 domain-containing protein n=1 Tax=Caenibius sp. WL TaxID=2872646 RepID=UPI001C99078A|nr:DUF1214 domain-containing protein [Caenibius sp. WL]QZP07634.1 DUF1214 domain-containing protein [Caenibius sp. WL]
MKFKTILPFFLAGSALCAPAVLQATEPAAATTAGVADGKDLAAAWDEFTGTLGKLTSFLRQHPFYAEPENRAAAYAYLTSMMVARIEEDVIFDPDFPYFRVLDHRIREGGDNPDQRYLMSLINGGQTYRIWGKIGKERRLDFQVYAGDPFVPNGGRAAGFLSSDNLKVASDGSFEVWVSPERREGNWLENPADGNQILVRQIFSDWKNEVPGDVHIDRVGHEGELKPVLTDQIMANRLRRAAADLERHVKVWPSMVGNRYLSLPPNTISQPSDPGALGGVPGRFMVSGNFDLAPDEALIVRTWPMSGNYQGIQLADPWFSSLEYGNRQTSLTGDQSYRSSDGSYYYVVTAIDPGVPNWLDTYSRKRGVLLLRFDGMTEKVFEPKRYPTAQKIKLDQLKSMLPKDTPQVSQEHRKRELSERRRHVQLRYDN